MKQLKSLCTFLLAMTSLAAAIAAPIELKLDMAKTGAPISLYIYGQFVEHLGRCIYGGIWAQMLEDRKFYFPITADYSPYRDLTNSAFPVVGASPWQMLGASSGVAMVKEGAFVGRHSPRINGGTGIRQRDLGLVAGKGYEGYLWAKPLDGSAEIEVTLAWGEGDAERASSRLKFSGGKYSKKAFSFTSQAGTNKGMLDIRVLNGDVLLGPPSLMPADNVRGMRADTLALLKQLNGSVYRWPGGNFVSGYDWRDGIGDRDRRPPRKNPAWTGVEHNDFGTDEFIAFCRELNTEPMIAVNTGFGDAYSAAQWVEYCNASTKTIGGGWRAKNGHNAPYGVKFWCVGNEMFGPWQLGFMQMEHYTLKHNTVVEYMWKVDPSIKLTGVGDLDTINRENDPNQARLGKTCSQIMLEQCADHMTMLSEHFYRGRVPWQRDERTNLLAHVATLKDAIRQKADGHRKLQGSLANLQGRLVPIAMDEWNFWHREYAYGELGCIYELQDGLGVAAGLQEYFRQSDLIQMAHYAQTVNVIGAIKTTKTAAEMETTGLVLQMYRAHYGQIPLRVEQDFAPCDVAAALTKDSKALTIGVMNPTESEIELAPSVSGAMPTGSVTRWHITGPSATAHNTPGKPRVVDIQLTDHLAVTSPLRVPALGATIFVLPLNRSRSTPDLVIEPNMGYRGSQHGPARISPSLPFWRRCCSRLCLEPQYSNRVFNDIPYLDVMAELSESAESLVLNVVNRHEQNALAADVALQHGWGENEYARWNQGRANLIMDNLIAEGKTRPFIIVMTYGLTNEGPGPGGRRGGGGAGTAAGSTNTAAAGTNAAPAGRGPGGRRSGMNPFTGAAAAFEVVLVRELISYIDANFCTLSDQPHRGMAGLSMGGMETKIITLKNLAKFSHVGLFSGGVITPTDVENTPGFKERVKVVFCSCGSRENPGNINSNHEALDKAGIKNTAYVSLDAAHEFLTWRRSLREFAPLLFQDWSSTK